MTRRPAHRARLRGVVTLLAVAATAGIVVAMLVPPSQRAAADDGPSWSEVQNAKKNKQAKAKEVARIESVLSGLEQKAAQLGEAAVKAAVAAEAAETALAKAQSTLDSLTQQSATFQKAAVTARRDAGIVTTQLYRAGDPTLTVWLSGGHSASLLYRLGALQQIGGSSTARLAQAKADEQQASALGQQATVAARIRDSLAKQAETASAQAKAAQQAADAEVASTKSQQARLQAQLKSLAATYATKKSEYAAAQAAKAAAAANGEGGGSTGSLGSLSGDSGSLSPGGAQSYASGRMSAYGWGSGQFSCLVSLWNIESGWRWDAYNASSGAYGIPQALPASKMSSAGSDWSTSSSTQINWGLAYINSVYGSPCAAYDFETSHTPYWY